MDGFPIVQSAVKIKNKYYGIVMTMHSKCIKNFKLKKMSDVYNLGIQLIQRCKDLHSLGFLHLDIKPSNIMVDSK